MSPSPKKVVYKERDDHLVRAHTTVGAQSVPQDSMDINKTQSKANLGEKSPEDPRCQDTTGDGAASARQETLSKRSHDSPRVGKIPKGDDDRYTHNVSSQGTLIKQQAMVIAQQQELLKKQGVEVEKL